MDDVTEIEDGAKSGDEVCNLIGPSLKMPTSLEEALTMETGRQLCWENY